MFKKGILVKQRCLRCNRVMQQLNENVNYWGNYSQDWATRRYHKKCYKEIEFEKSCERNYKEYIKEKST